MNNQFSPGNGASPPDEKVRFHKRLERHLFRTTIAGFIILFPLFVTIIVMVALFNYVHSAFGALVRLGGNYLLTVFNAHGTWVESIVLAAGPLESMIILLIMLYIFGVLIKFSAGRKAVQIKQAVLSNLPVTKAIYKVARQVMESVIAQGDGRQFSRVVFVEWPREGYLAIGFITAHCYSEKISDQSLMVVYIPTVPNPTSGNLAYIPEDEVVETDLTVEEAMKIVFSGGMVHPDRMRAEVTEGAAKDADEIPDAQSRRAD